MKIYGGRDYYDCGLSYGIDPAIVLIREKSKSVVFKKMLGRELQLYGMGRHGWQTIHDPVLRTATVVFCQKLYRGAEVDGEWFWSAEGMLKWIDRQRQMKVEVVTPWRWKNSKDWPITRYFEPKPISEEIRDYMTNNKVAIMVEEPRSRGERNVRQEEVLINPACLGKMGFMKALDPYTAFQELSMWIGGILGGTSPETVRITDDKVLIENHGYDKHSFRSSTRTV